MSHDTIHLLYPWTDSGDFLAHHAVPHPLGTDVAEAGLLEKAPGAVVEDRYLLAAGVMRVPCVGSVDPEAEGVAGRTGIHREHLIAVGIVGRSPCGLKLMPSELDRPAIGRL